MKKAFLILTILFALACSNEADTQGTEKKIFKYNQPSALNSLDPAFAKDQASIWVANQMFNSLVQLDEALNIQPALAKRWESSPDGKQLTFHLAYPVLFHDHSIFENGRDRLMTAEDVVFSFNRIIDPEVASPGAWIFNDRVSDENPFVALNDSTVQINLKEAFQPILGILAMQYCSVVSKKAVDHFGKDFRANPVGTGPFKLKQWRENDVLLLDDNQNYWEQDERGKSYPYMDGVRVSFNENKKNAWLQLLEGKLDFISGLDPTYKDEALDADGNLQAGLEQKINLLKGPYLNTEYLGFNMSSEHPIVQDKLLRQAINYAFDRAKMIQFLRNNIGTPAESGFIPKGLPAHNAEKVKGYSYNPKRALALMKKAGYPNGEGIPEIKLETTAAYKDLCTYFQSALEKVGIPIRIELSPPAYLREKVAKGDAAFFRGSWLADYPDGENYLTVFYGGNPAPPNYTRFKNEKFDALYESALLEVDASKRQSMYQAMDKILIEEAPIIPLFYDEILRFTSKRVSGLDKNASNLLNLKKVRLN